MNLMWWRNKITTSLDFDELLTDFPEPVPDTPENEAVRIEAYLRGNCLSCLTRKAVDGMPRDVVLCYGCAEREGWNRCVTCRTWGTDWHRWDSWNAECTVCLTENGHNEEGDFWDPDDICCCDQCFDMDRQR